MVDMSSKEIIVVTGASRGVGRAVVTSLVKEHDRSVLAVARDASALQELERECKTATGILEILPVDLTVPPSIEAVRQAAAGRRVAALVNNAGLLIKRPADQWASDDLQRIFSTNVFAPLLLIQALASHLMGDPPGHVVNIGSMGGFQGSVKFPGLAAYSASKAALANLTECFAEEWKDQGIRFNCLALGSVDTDMLREAFPGFRSPTSSSEMGAFIARFALEGHRQFNGKVLPVAVSTP